MDQTMDRKRAELTARTELPANVAAQLKGNADTETRRHGDTEIQPPLLGAGPKVRVPRQRQADQEEYTIALKNVAPPAESALNVTIDAKLKQQLEDAVFRGRRARSPWGTQRSIVEAALAMWLESQSAQAA